MCEAEKQTLPPTTRAPCTVQTGFGYLLLPPLNPPAKPPLPCGTGSGKGWLLPPRKSHLDTPALPHGSAAMGRGLHHSITAFFPSRIHAPPPEEEILAGEALTGATDQKIQRASSEHVPALPSRCRRGNPAQTQAEEELVSPFL